MDTSRTSNLHVHPLCADDHALRDNPRCVDVVLLAGTLGSEVSWTCGWSRHALPLPGTTIIESLITRLSQAFDGSITICANGHTEMLDRLVTHPDEIGQSIRFIQDTVPRGTAGCLKLCESNIQGHTIFLATGAIYLEDNPSRMVEQHRQSGNALTVFCKKEVNQHVRSDQQNTLHPTGLYCCDPIVFKYIRSIGFQDLKEQLIPTLRRAGLRVGVVMLEQPAYEITEWESYLHVVSRSITHFGMNAADYRQLAPDIWCGKDVEIASNARIVGPVVLGKGCRLDEHSMVVGPAILGDGCHVCESAWAIRVVIPDHIQISAGVSVIDQFVAPATTSLPVIDSLRNEVVSDSIVMDESDSDSSDNFQPASVGAGKSLAMVTALAALFIWAFRDTWGNLWNVWQNRPDYSAGQLVPMASLFMIYSQRKYLRNIRLMLRPTGFLVFALGVIIHILGSLYYYSSLENFGLVVSVNGMAMSLVGMKIYRNICYPLLFLFLMLPFPWLIHDAVMLPLQGMAAASSETILEILGIPVARFGHVLQVAGHKVSIAEACSGLRLALAFLIVTGVTVYFSRRPNWQKVFVFLSSIPIALACNILRIVGSASLYHFGYDRLADGAFHDAAGLMMMPVALGFIAFEFWLLSNLVISVDPSDAVMIRIKRPQTVTVR